MAFRLTFTLHQLVRQMDMYADAQLQRRFHVTYNQFEFLAVLLVHQPVDMTALARHLGVTKAAVSKRIPALVELGFIQTSTDTPNRSILLTLTDEGQSLVERAAVVLEKAFQELLQAQLTESDVLDLEAKIDLLNKALSEKELV